MYFIFLAHWCPVSGPFHFASFHFHLQLCYSSDNTLISSLASFLHLTSNSLLFIFFPWLFHSHYFIHSTFYSLNYLLGNCRVLQSCHSFYEHLPCTINKETKQAAGGGVQILLLLLSFLESNIPWNSIVPTLNLMDHLFSVVFLSLYL